MTNKKSFFSVAKKSFPFVFGGIWLFCGLPFLIIGLYVGIDAFRLQQHALRGTFIIMAGVLLFAVGLCGVFVVIGSNGIKLLVGGALAYALARTAIAFARA